MDVGILSSQSFSFFFIILLPGERLKGAVVFLIGIFLLSAALFVIARSNEYVLHVWWKMVRSVMQVFS